MDNEQMCRALLACEDEQAAEAVLTASGVWNDPRTWSDFGGQENNFSTIGNQQANPEAALVEKLINSIDAVLTLECRRAGLDPEGPQAPTSVKEAVSRFFGIRDGNLAELTATELTGHAARIGLVATGSKRLPNLTVIDTGEGQEPDEFPNTFLSLGRSNKLKIPFVQGKFNMGGTGVLQFCGERNLQLIVSRRHPDLVPSDDSWGFTVVRRDNPSGGVRSSVYRYLQLAGRIPRFQLASGETFRPRLDETISGTSELPEMMWGTVIKLFGYQLPGGAKTNILFDLFNDLSCLMPGVALPIRFYERRLYSGHTFESNLIGLEARLSRDTSDNLEFRPTNHTLLPDSLRLPAQVYAFKRKTDGASASEKFRGREGVIVAVNGQGHGYLDKAIFRRGSLNLSYVADDLLVLVDATFLDGRTREDLFMNSRDRLREGPYKKDIEQALEAMLREHGLLKEINSARREASLGKKLEEDKALEEILKDIVMRSPVLAALFFTGNKIPDAVSARPAAPVNLAFVGKRFPTYFALAKGESRGTAHLGQRFRVQFETDAQNDYFHRTEEPGQLSLSTVDADAEGYVVNLMNGVGTLNVRLPEIAVEGESLEWEGEVGDVSRVNPIAFSFERSIIGRENRSGGGTGTRKPPVKPDPGERATSNLLALPPIVSVRKEHWKEHGFDASSALAVKGGSDGGFDFYVNLDNKFLAAEIRGQRGKRPIYEAQFKYGLALFGLAAITYAQKSVGEDEDIETVVGQLSNAFAPFLLPMISGLSALDEEIEAEDTEDADED